MDDGRDNPPKKAIKAVSKIVSRNTQVIDRLQTGKRPRKPACQLFPASIATWTARVR
jgi:hypothetical protein